MGIALFHLLPESSESFTEYFEDNQNNSKWKNLPSSFFIAFISYSLILLLEKVAFDSHSITEHDHGDHHKSHHSHDDHSSDHRGSDLILPLLEKDHHDHEHENHDDHSHKNVLSEIKESEHIKKNFPNEKNFNEKKDNRESFKLQKKSINDRSNIFKPQDSPIKNRDRTQSVINIKKPLNDELNVKEKGYEEDDIDHDTNGEEESEDDDELILKNVVSSKGKFASYLQARNIRIIHLKFTIIFINSWTKIT
jgi:hypothetical protein